MHKYLFWRNFYACFFTKTAWTMTVPAHIPVFTYFSAESASFSLVFLCIFYAKNVIKYHTCLSTAAAWSWLLESYINSYFYIRSSIRDATTGGTSPCSFAVPPWYLCIVLIFMHKYSPITRTICTYLQDFSLLGGIMALAEPSGLMQPYVTLTIHGLTWHLILILIGLYCHRCGLAGKSWREYAKTLPLLAVFLAFASIINVATHGQADMFYISPFYPVTQVFFYQVSLLVGTGAGIVFYIFSICLGGWIIHYCLGKL